MARIIDRTHKYLADGRSWHQRNPSQIKTLTVHHSAIPHANTSNDNQTLDLIESIHLGHGWPGISYHYVIPESGKIYKINNHEDITWHDTVNIDSLGILVDGYFHPDVNDRPTQPQLNSLRWLLDKLSTQHPEFPADQDDVVGHRERSATACPGDNLIGYVVDYRSKKGNVNWGDGLATDSSCLKKLGSLEKVLKKEQGFLEDERKKYKREKAKVIKLESEINNLGILIDEKNAKIKELLERIVIAENDTDCQKLREKLAITERKIESLEEKLKESNPINLPASTLFRLWLEKVL